MNAMERCHGDKACPFPVWCEGLCRHHHQFYAFTESMTDASLDYADYLQRPDGPTPTLSTISRRELSKPEPFVRVEKPKPVTKPYCPGPCDAVLKRWSLIKELLATNQALTHQHLADLLTEKGIPTERHTVILDLRRMNLSIKTSTLRSADLRKRRMLEIVKGRPSVKAAELAKMLQAEGFAGTSQQNIYSDLASFGIYGHGPISPKRKDERRILVAQMAGRNLTIAQIRNKLALEHDIRVSFACVWKDCIKMGIRAHPRDKAFRACGAINAALKNLPAQSAAVVSRMVKTRTARRRNERQENAA